MQPAGFPSVQHDLIFDVGLHLGEDSAYYLRKGYRVVAVEANPALVEQTLKRFADDDRITILNGAIERGRETIPFYIDKNSVWGTVDTGWASRNKHLGSSQELISVPIIDISSIFQQFGVPYYLKLDIEGRERVILDVLRHLPEKPRFLSMESEKVRFRELLRDLFKLSSLGYRRFKIVQQRDIPNSTIKTTDRWGHPLEYTFEPHASGPFGDDLPGRWLTLPETIARFVAIFASYRIFGDYGLLFRIPKGRAVYERIARRFGRLPGWHDTHAKQF
jgi:FkbM family methyltransferase